MAAALAANAIVAAWRYPSAGPTKGLVHWVHLHYVCIGAFTTPVTAGRQLHIIRGSGGDASGGTDLDVSRNQSDLTETKFTGQIATTAGLTMTNVVFTNEVPKARLLLAHAGFAGQDYDEIWRFDDPLVLLPGELHAIRTPTQFDAAGTWQLEVKVGAGEL